MYVHDTKTDVLMTNIELSSLYCNNVCSAACVNACNSLETVQNRTTVHIPDTQTIEKTHYKRADNTFSSNHSSEVTEIYCFLLFMLKGVTLNEDLFQNHTPTCGVEAYLKHGHIIFFKSINKIMPSTSL